MNHDAQTNVSEGRESKDTREAQGHQSQPYESPIILTEKESARIYRLIDKNGPTIRDLTPCWIWLGDTHTSYGYGRLHFRGKRHAAHRLLFVIHGGALTREKTDALHKCDNPPCCNPEHIFAGTDRDNVRDAFSKNRRLTGEKHPKARLRAVEVACARILFECGSKNHSELGRFFGVHLSVMRNAILGIRWNHDSRIPELIHELKQETEGLKARIAA